MSGPRLRDTRPQVTLVSPTSAGPSQTVEVRVEATDNVGLRRMVANIYDATTNTLVKSTQTPITTPSKSGVHTATVTLLGADSEIVAELEKEALGTRDED